MRKLTGKLWFLGLITLVVFPLLALPIFYFSDQSFLDLFIIASNTIFALPTFFAAGILFGILMIWLSELPFFERAISDYKSVFSGFKITIWRAIYLSICAGVGEEIFFRGAVQPLLGIWITAIFFVAIHTYYSFKNWKKTLFGVLLTFFIVFLGWGAEKYSLYHAMAGHFSYDLVLLLYMRKDN